MKLMIGITTYGVGRQEFTIDSGWPMMFHIGRHHREIDDVMVMRETKTYRQAARQGIVDTAMEWGATHILMHDDDHDFTTDAIDLLLESIHKDGIECVSALYFTRGLPTVPCIWKYAGASGTVPIFYYPKNELMEVDVVGFGLVLFRTSAFQRMNPPYFDLGKGTGEDAAFCLRLQQTGGRIWCHTGAKIGHMIENPYKITEEDYERERASYEANARRDEITSLRQVDGPPPGVTPLSQTPGSHAGGKRFSFPRRFFRPPSKRFWNAGRNGTRTGLETGNPEWDARCRSAYAHEEDAPEEPKVQVEE